MAEETPEPRGSPEGGSPGGPSEQVTPVPASQTTQGARLVTGLPPWLQAAPGFPQGVFQAFQASITATPVSGAEELAKYNGVIEGGANRVWELIEGQATHRQQLETKSVDADIWLRKVGLLGALVLSAGAIGGGIWLIANGKDIGALGPVLTAVAVLAGVFVWWRKTRPPQQPPGPAPGTPV